ncbi:hypothetical protein LTR66_005075 [Elasticomyces elasticus]|nr:hypothetical protein LTR28_006870 [Elasticomyces elasticus]KAK4995020.1 hypothetical protein LTR66_005075 [Elasticomyces elasticus]
MATDLTELENDPRLFLYTSLTSGSSHIITATSRLETILKANKIPFQAIDTATDEKARKLWGRRAGKRKLPGLVKEGYVIGDLEEVEEWNEFGELKETIGPVPAAQPTATTAPPPPSTSQAQPGAAHPSHTQTDTPDAARENHPPALLDASKTRPPPDSPSPRDPSASKPETTTSSARSNDESGQTTADTAKPVTGAATDKRDEAVSSDSGKEAAGQAPRSVEGQQTEIGAGTGEQAAGEGEEAGVSVED